MPRWFLALLVAPLFGLVLKTSMPAAPSFDRAQGIAWIDRTLRANQLTQDAKSDLSISGQQAGVVYGKTGCEGALIVVPLPPTAQSFDQVIAGFDRDVLTAGFVYRGVVYSSHPTGRRFVDQVTNAVRFVAPGPPPAKTTVFAFKELGSCHLSRAVDWRITLSQETF